MRNAFYIDILDLDERRKHRRSMFNNNEQWEAKKFFEFKRLKKGEVIWVTRRERDNSAIMHFDGDITEPVKVISKEDEDFIFESVVGGPRQSADFCDSFQRLPFTCFIRRLNKREKKRFVETWELEMERMMHAITYFPDIPRSLLPPNDKK